MKKMNQQNINKIIFCKLFESDMSLQSQIDTKTNNQISNDSFTTNVPTNKTSLKRIPSDIPTPSPDQVEYEEYLKWLTEQLYQWYLQNPKPIRDKGMSDVEYRFLMEVWERERALYIDYVQQWYIWNTGPGRYGPYPDPRPKPKPKPRPQIVDPDNVA